MTVPAAPARLVEAITTAAGVLADCTTRAVAATDQSITLPQLRLLEILAAQGPLKISALADYLVVNASTASRMADRLIRSDLISRQVNPTSRREIVVDLTRTGVAVVRQVDQLRGDEIAAVVARMPRTAWDELLRVLDAFNAASRSR
ncbi:MAG TPA: MarR family transcriptional regulator [Mycobacterium sp.]|nr:MarR family transcriptional regulator [Mycobacterium sp.]